MDFSKRFFIKTYTNLHKLCALALLAAISFQSCTKSSLSAGPGDSPREEEKEEFGLSRPPAGLSPLAPSEPAISTIEHMLPSAEPLESLDYSRLAALSSFLADVLAAQSHNITRIDHALTFADMLEALQNNREHAIIDPSWVYDAKNTAEEPRASGQECPICLATTLQSDNTCRCSHCKQLLCQHCYKRLVEANQTVKIPCPFCLQNAN